jgi:hypothetical protein
MGVAGASGLALALLLLAAPRVAQAQAQPAPAPPPAPRRARPAAPRPPPPRGGETPSDAQATRGGTAVSAQELPAPPPPPPWEGTSTAGAGLMPLRPPPVEAPPAPPPPRDTARDDSQDSRIRALEARIDAAERAALAMEERLGWLKRLRVSGYVQGQGLWQWYNAAASPNLVDGVLPTGIGANSVVAKPDPTTGLGVTTNGDYFRLRRAHLKTELMPADFARLVFEIDPTPPGWNGGVNTIVRELEAQGIARWARDVRTEFAVGVFEVPFGFEVQQPHYARPFIEPSWGERNLFPQEFDTGAHAYTSALHDRLTVQLAILNGVMEGEPTFSLIPDLNKGKDLVGRVNFNAGPLDAGASGYYGQGQIVDPVGLRFKQFPRWAANVELGVHHVFVPRLGETRLYAEGTIAQNMDRGVNYAFALPGFPTDVVNGTVASLTEWSAWGRLEQDITEWFTLGLRFDYYTPDASQGNDGRATYAAVAVLHFTSGLQYMLEYDHAVDDVRPSGTAAPNRQIDQLSNTLQVRFF